MQTLDLVDNTVGDLTTIISLTLTLEACLLSLGGRLGLDLNTLGFGTLTRGFLFALCRVDGIHGVLDLWTRIDCRDQRLDYGETEAGHFIADGLLHVEGYIVLAGECIVQR